MKAEDTVMSNDKDYVDALNLNPKRDGKKLGRVVSLDSYFRTSLYYVAQAQAEISFKAGIREATEWIRHRYTKPAGSSFWVLITYDEWQAKLKEWGLKEVKDGN